MKKVLGLFKKEPDVRGWFPADGAYPRLSANITGVPARPGVYTLWHRGVRPQWLRVGAANNLASMFAEMVDAPEIVALGVDVFVTWALPPANQHAGIIRFLADVLQPALQDTVDAVAPIAFPLPPGTTL